ncbi:YbaK/EbsC family protein [Kitasatospora sp. McL0602]|uniref:YbaK/EbsC family protein n=1 Tax=Kitasatospora sp. McL0602 TaxID=3439530 RepID=UPI003F8970BB
MTVALLTESPAEVSTYGRLMELLEGAGPGGLRIIDHEPEGNTAAASELRGHPLEQAAKCIVVRVKLAGGGERYALAVVPGDRRVDLDAVGRLLGGTRVGFADRTTAERLTGCVSGSIIPFSFHPELQLVVAPELLTHSRIYFNVARLDRSAELSSVAYQVLAQPQVVPIAV